MDFSFITDEGFHQSLNYDYRELVGCSEASAWKAVQVLAGSIVEALLVEYLVVSGIKPNGKDPLTIDLSEAVKACQDGVLQKSTASLCDVVRDYRNLIHPGRLIRTNQEIGEEKARIAASLVGLITKEVAEKRKLTYGFTAEQLLRKLQNDEHSLVLLPELLAQNERARAQEIRNPRLARMLLTRGFGAIFLR
jgi:hypothetical protein